MIIDVKSDNLAKGAAVKAQEDIKHARAQALGALRILFIDDSEMQRKIAKIYIEKGLDCELFFACNGKEGYEQALALVPDLILSDVEMPICDGMETLKNLKSNPMTADIPVIMCTSVKKEEIKNECLRLGALEYINKPHGYTRLKDIIATLRNSTGKTAHFEDKKAQ